MKILNSAAQTTLDGAINNVVTTLTIVTTGGSPATAPFRIWIDREMMLVMDVSGDVYTVIRGAEGTTAASHSDGAVILYPLVGIGGSVFAGVIFEILATGTISGGGASWGSITGTLSSQTDLQSALDGKVSDTAYDATSWNGVTSVAPSKNAVRDKFESLTSPVDDTAYDATSWNGVTTIAPSKNAVRDKIESMSAGSGSALITSVVYNGGTVSTVSGSFADIDTSNLVVTFTKPASGSFIVRLKGFCDSSNNSGKYSWGLAGTGLSGTYQEAVTRTDSGTLQMMEFIVTGQSAGSATITWQHATTGGTGRILMSGGGADFGPGVMEVWSL